MARAKALFIPSEQLPDPSNLDLPHPERSFRKMSQELWEMVIDYLPSLTGRHASQAFNFQLTQQHWRHSNIWNQIIKDKETWTSIAMQQGLNFFLVGDDLYSLYRDLMHKAYIALLTRDKIRNIRHEKTKLLASLRAYN